MTVLIVVYELSNPGQNYDEIIRRIKAYGTWARLGGSEYLIYTNSTPIQVRDNLKAALDTNDKLFVGTCVAPAAWTGYGAETDEWIKSKVR